jgi:hypothetical protein
MDWFAGERLFGSLFRDITVNTYSRHYRNWLPDSASKYFKLYLLYLEPNGMAV